MQSYTVYARYVKYINIIPTEFERKILRCNDVTGLVLISACKQSEKPSEASRKSGEGSGR